MPKTRGLTKGRSESAIRFWRGERGFSGASRAFAFAASLAAFFGQFFALSHEITVRHFRCAEHGELTHVPLATAAAPRGASDVTVVRGAETEPSDAHDHCLTAFRLQTGVTSSVLWTTVQAVPPPAPVWRENAAPPRERAFLLATAPKTSPPSA